MRRPSRNAFLIGGVVWIAGATVGHLTGSHSSSAPAQHHDTRPLLGTVVIHEPVKVPGPVRTVQAPLPAQCVDALGLSRQLLRPLNDFSRLDGQHRDNLDQAADAMAEGSITALNHVIQREIRIKARTDPDAVEIMDLYSSLKDAYAACQAARQ